MIDTFETDMLVAVSEVGQWKKERKFNKVNY